MQCNAMQCNAMVVHGDYYDVGQPPPRHTHSTGLLNNGFLPRRCQCQTKSRSTRKVKVKVEYKQTHTLNWSLE